MTSVSTPMDLYDYRSGMSGSVGFVPTMGALHQGHLSLIKRAREENDHVIVSIFVNPTQFLEGEDLDQYPRKPDADKNICEKAGVDLLFLPNSHSMYFENEPFLNAPSGYAYILEGHKRPGHFDGVLQVVNKLFNLIHPTRAYFGKKDAQQLILIQNMVETLFIPTEVIPCETVRDPDGLALSSRNIYLSIIERNEALLISKALKKAGQKIMVGCVSVQEVIDSMYETLQPLDVEYIHITDRKLQPVERIEKSNTLILIAAKVGKIRLIDNFWI